MIFHNSLSIIYWNAQCIRNKISESFLYFNTEQIDIVIFSETWLKPTHIISTPNYDLYRNDRIGKIGGGVAIAIRKGIKHSLLTDINTSIIETIGVEVSGPNCDIKFIATYFSGTKLDPSKLKAFKIDIQKLTSLKGSYFVCGDFNAKHRLWNCRKANKAGQIIFDEMCIRNFIVEHPHSPTYFPPQRSRTTPSTLDIVLTNGLTPIKHIRTIESLSSDHLPVLFDVDFLPSIVKNRRKVPCYAKANWSLFKNKISDNLKLPLNINSMAEVDIAINAMVDTISLAESSVIPYVKTRERCLKLSPNIISLISKRNAIRRQWQRTRSTLMKNQVIQLSKEIKTQINLLENQTFNKKLKKLTIGSRQLWRTTKLLKNASNEIPPLKNANNKILLGDTQKADEIAYHFSKSNQITFSNKSDKLTESKVLASIHNMNYFKPVISELDLPKPIEIIKSIKNLKSRKSPGVDKINNILLKNLPKKAIVFMNSIFRACFKLQYYPTVWKHAKIIAIPKLGKDVALASSYRPISLLSSISKILERIVLTRMQSYIASKNIIINQQFGFREGHSSTHQLLRLTNYIKGNINSKRSCGLLTFDIEKAFDTVWHDGLLHKMFVLKFPLYIIKIVQSYLSNRSFFVSIKNSISKSHLVLAGVPQGSVISPFLFQIFTSDIKFPSDSEIFLYADDTAVCCAAKNPTKIINTLNACSTQLLTYFQTWKIQLNSNKTQATYFTRRKCAKLLPTETVTIQSQHIPWSDSVKYLGVILDKTLTFKSHTNYSTERALKYIKVLFPLICRRSKLNTKNKILIYKSIFRSILLYAGPVWIHCAKTHINSIQLVQNKILKIILKKSVTFSTELLHREANIELIINQLRKLNDTFSDKCDTSVNPLVRNLFTH